MNFKRREELTSEFFKKCNEILSSKGRDYTIDDQAFKEVHAIAEEMGTDAVKVLWVYMRKHITAVKTYVKKGQVESEPIDGRLMDLANYCALMYALIRDGQNGKAPVETLR